MRWLRPPMLRESLPRLLLDAPPMVSDPMWLSPPRCGKEREAGGTEDVEESMWWRCAANPEELHGDVVHEH